MVALRRREGLLAAAIVAAVVLLAAAVVSPQDRPAIPAAILLGSLSAYLAIRFATSWPRLLMAMGVVDILIPSDKRYTIGGGLPFNLEPYRVVVGALIIGWLITLAVDPRARPRRTTFEGPIGLILLATIGSDLVNPGRVEVVTSYVVKALWLFVSFIVFLYLFVGVTKSRKTLDRLAFWLVLSGCVEAVGGMVQRQTGFNIFDHLHGFLPFLTFNNGVELDTLVRGGAIRALSSAGHPIELSNTMAMLIPLAAYLGVTRRQLRWLLVIGVLLLGCFSSDSKTGVLELAAMTVVLFWLRPWHVLRWSPALIPLLIAVHFVAPGAIGQAIGGFFPKGGLIAAQSTTFRAGNGQVIDNTRLSRIGPEINGVYLQHNLLFGEGFGTRVTGRVAGANTGALDDQWFDNLLETGLLGFLGWLWLFVSVVAKAGRYSKRARGTPEGWLGVALACSMTGYAIAVFTYDAFGFIQATFLFYMLLGCVGVLLQLPRANPTPPPPLRVPEGSAA